MHYHSCSNAYASEKHDCPTRTAEWSEHSANQGRRPQEDRGISADQGLAEAEEKSQSTGQRKWDSLLKDDERSGREEEHRRQRRGSLPREDPKYRKLDGGEEKAA